ncbi:pathogenicity island protein [uncultured Methylobacterium sp.]|jgi:Flp pilus assembly protein TadD|uniref:pathogenicity island protein n=1 Tax=uncultured Methylobacterium sp. TaxID=157278 RepID=UPI00261203D1|nr:pathogenicity island protein [uncultured Methylobacterium sp.]
MNQDSHGDTQEELRRFLDGGVRDAIGLRSEDLSVGLEVARNHLRRGAPAEAFRIYVGLILCEPTNVEFQVGLANCALHLEEAHLALQAASAVVSLAPKDPRGYYLSGRACLTLGHLAEAQEDLTDAVARAREARDAATADAARRLLQSLTLPAAPATAGA